MRRPGTGVPARPRRRRLDAVGAAGPADPAWFPTDGLVHLDLHTDNILAGDDGTLTGTIDWEGACAGAIPASIWGDVKKSCQAVTSAR